MARIIRCDRCGAEITGGGVGYIAWNWRDLKTDDLIDGNPFEDKDFCRSCMDQIKDFINAPVPTATAEEIKQANKALDPPVVLREEKEPDPEPTRPKEPESDSIADAINEMLAKEKKAFQMKGSVDLKKLQELVRAGKNPKEIAEYFGISLASYYKYRKKAEALYISGDL